MKLSQLLRQREALLRQARLANLAFAYESLRRLVARLTRARLTGEVLLQPTSAEAERHWPVLTAREGSQAVIEEHFTDEDVLDLADLIAFATGEETGEDTVFRLEDLETRFLAPLRHRLAQRGVELEPENPPVSGESARRQD